MIIDASSCQKGHVVSWWCWVRSGVQGGNSRDIFLMYLTYLSAALQVQVGPGCSETPFWSGTDQSFNEVHVVDSLQP